MSGSQSSFNTKNSSFILNKSISIPPIAICLDSQSENQLIPEKVPQNVSSIPNPQVDKPKPQLKRKRIIRGKKLKKIQRQPPKEIMFEQNYDDDIIILTDKRKSVRISKKRLVNYKPPLRNKNTKKSKNDNKDKNDNQKQGQLNQKQAINTNEVNCSLGNIAEESSIQALLSKKIDMEGLSQVGGQDFEKKGNLSEEINKDKGVQANQEGQCLQEDKENWGKSNLNEPKEQQMLQVQENSIVLPSDKFVKEFLLKDTSKIDRRQAIFQSVLRHKVVKPSKYYQQYERILQKQVEKRNVWIQDSLEDDRIPVLQNVTIEEEIQSIDIEEEIQNQISKLSQVCIPIQNDKFNGLNQNQPPPQDFTQTPPEQMVSQSFQTNQVDLQPNEIRESISHQRASKSSQDAQSLRSVELCPGQKFIKQKIISKQTKKTHYYSSTQDITEHWKSQNSSQLSFQEEYPFYQKPKLQPNIFNSELKNIITIRKFERPQIEPICLVTFEQNLNTTQHNPSFNSQFPKPTHYQVELCKVRLLYPEKLLEFYQMIQEELRKKAQNHHQTENQYSLSEKTQRIIKHSYN